jgi:UDP-N-acetylglucosamine 4,6-dehydratase
MLSKKSVLITSGTGSIGRRYVKTLLERFLPKRLLVHYGGGRALAIVQS